MNAIARNAVVELLSETSVVLDPAIDDCVRTVPPTIRPVVTHALRPTGNRERALLVRLGWELGRPDFQQVVAAAVSVELLHFSTLVIDDFLDKSALRGGEGTVASVHGGEIAVVVGELLLSLSLRAMADAIRSAECSDAVGLSAMGLIQDAHLELYEGQYLDLLFENRERVCESEYLEMISKTTGALAEASATAGAILRGATAEEIHGLRTYGRFLGIALQIRNDVSELIGDPEAIGRHIGDDVRCGKKRLPWIHALEHASVAQSERILNVLGQPTAEENDIRELAEILWDIGAIQYCVRQIQCYCTDAAEALSQFPDSRAKAGLLGLAAIVASEW